MLLKLLQDLLADYRNGKIKWTVSNQHYEYVLESAIENYTPEKGLEFLEGIAADNKFNIMNFAFELSTFDIQPLDNAWTR